MTENCCSILQYVFYQYTLEFSCDCNTVICTWLKLASAIVNKHWSVVKRKSGIITNVFSYQKLYLIYYEQILLSIDFQPGAYIENHLTGTYLKQFFFLSQILKTLNSIHKTIKIVTPNQQHMLYLYVFVIFHEMYYLCLFDARKIRKYCRCR